MYQVQITIQHECYNVSISLTPAANIVEGIVIGAPSKIVNVPQFTMEDLRLSCVNYNLQYANNASVIGISGNQLIGMSRDSNDGSFNLEIKSLTLGTMSPQQVQFKLEGQNAYIGSPVSTLISLTYCSMSPSSLDINIFSPYSFPTTPELSYTIGSSAVIFTFNQFQTEDICASKLINLAFRIVTLDSSNGNVLTSLPLPVYIITSSNAGGFTGGQISILSSDYSISSSDFFI